MKVKVTDNITDYYGDNIKDGDKDLNYRSVFATALNTILPDETITAEQKARMYALSVKLFQGDTVDFGVEEAALVKERVGKIYNPLLYGRVSDLLNSK